MRAGSEARDPPELDAADAPNAEPLPELGPLPPAVVELIRRAKDGDGGALAELLGAYRPLLRLRAQRRLGRRIIRRIDASDVVQQTLLEAHRDMGQFLGSAQAELEAWLLCILSRNLASAIRAHLLVQRRAVGREQSLDDSRGAGALLRQRLAGTLTSPTGRLARNEKALRLYHALNQLPADQREAVRLRHVEGYTLDEIAERMARTPMAAASLIKRGMETLRRRFRPGDDAA